MTRLAHPDRSVEGYRRTMEFRVLGPVEAVGQEGRIAVGGPKQRTVLALLIAGAGRQVSTDALIYGVYGDTAPDKAHRSIHTYVSNLRGKLGGAIAGDGYGYQLRAEPTQIDAARFEQLVWAAGQEDDQIAAGGMLRDALGLWRGHPYADVDRPSLSPEITRLNQMRIAALEARVDADLEAGLDRELLGELDSLVAENPLHEGFRAQQMLALYRAGRHAEALRVFERLRVQLVEEMGLDPSPGLRELESRILNHDPTLAVARRPTVRSAAVLVVDIGDAAELARLAPHKRSTLLTDQAVVIDDAVIGGGGRVFSHTGTAAFAWFDSVDGVVRALMEVDRRSGQQFPRLKAAIAVGDLEVVNPDEVSGPPLSRAATLVSSAHPGQVLLATGAHEAIAKTGTVGLVVRSLGPHDIEGLAEGELIYQLGFDGSVEAFPPLVVGNQPAALPSYEARLPGYELRERIRSNPLGSVHRGYQPSVGREVAVTIVSPELANHRGFIRRFEIEAQMVSRLEHPRIVPLLDYWREPNGAYLVRRWMHGGTLADRVATALLTVDEMDTVVEAVGEALGYAHRSRVVHGNISPTSIVFDSNGNAYLGDFGVAQPSEPNEDPLARDVVDLALLIERCLGSDEHIEEFLAAATDPEGFDDISTLLQGWRRATDRGSHDPARTFTPKRNPYKGLRAFGELDAADFFGRREETQKLLGTVAERRLVVVVGPSGVGKSSVVRAGLTPQLRAGALPGSAQWLVADMTPGASPYQELAAALLRVAIEMPGDLESELRRGANGLIDAAARYLPRHATLLLVIDQFEELFTLTPDSVERERFLALISTAVRDEGSPLRVVITMRADFFDRPLGSGVFGDLLGDATVPLPVPSVSGLREMVEMPAAAVGVSFEPGLVDRIVGDVKDQAGALPLLEFSLTELFEGRTTDVLTLAAYDDTGGVLGALGRRAEEVYDELATEEKRAAREIFLRLVRVADSGRDTRRRIRRTELAHLGIGSEAIGNVLQAFAVQRLLTFDRDPITRGPTVEVAHEAILLEWPRLAEWIDGYREDLLLRARLTAAIAEWESSGRPDDALLTGGRLTQHEAWTAQTELVLSKPESEYLALSRAAEDEFRAHRRRARRRVTSAMATAAVVAVILATVAWVQRNSAEHARSDAAAQELALQAKDQLAEDPELSLLLAIEAVRAAQDADLELLTATTALRDALAANRILARFEGGGLVAVSPDRAVFATADSEGAVILREVGTGEEVALLARPGVGAIGASFSPDGEHIAVHYPTASDPVWLWNVGDGSHRAFDGPDTSAMTPPSTLGFDESGRFLAAKAPGEVTVWETSDGSVATSIKSLYDPLFLPGTDVLLIADIVTGGDGPTYVLRSFRTGTWEESDPVVLDMEPVSISAHSDGATLVVASPEEQRVAAYDLSADRGLLWEQTVSRPHGWVWLEESGQVAVGSDGGQIFVLDAETGDLNLTLDRGHAGTVWALADAGPVRIISAGFDGTTLLWSAEPGPIAEVAEIRTGVEALRLGGFAPYPTRVLVTDRADSSATVYDVKSGDVVREIQDPVVTGGLETLALAGGQVVVEATSQDGVLVRDAVSEEVIYRAPAGWSVWNVDNSLSYAFIVTSDVSDVKVVALPEGNAVFDVPGAWFPEFSHDGRYALVPSGGFDVYSTETRRRVASWPFVQVIEPMPDGRTASVLDVDGNLWLVDFQRLIDGATLEEAGIWSEFATDGPVFTAGHVINADGSLVAVAARTDDLVRIWQSDGTLVAAIDSNLTEAPPYVFFHPDEPHVTLVSDGGRFLTYTLDPDELLRIAKERVARSLTDEECRTFMRVDTCP